MPFVLESMAVVTINLDVEIAKPSFCEQYSARCERHGHRWYSDTPDGLCEQLRGEEIYCKDFYWPDQLRMICPLCREPLKIKTEKPEVGYEQPTRW